MIRRLIICIFIASTALAQTPGATQEARLDDNEGPVIQPNADAAGNASFIIEARRKAR